MIPPLSPEVGQRQEKEPNGRDHRENSVLGETLRPRVGPDDQ